MSTHVTHVIGAATQARASAAGGNLSVAIGRLDDPKLLLVGPWEHVIRVLLDASEAAANLSGTIDAETAGAA